MVRVLVLTDSVSLPRKHQNGVIPFESTYTHKLKQRYKGQAIFYFFQMGGATISDLYKQVNYFKAFQPDILILQVGIVDCAPRAFSRLEMELIRRFHLLRFTRPFINFLRKYRGLTYTSKSDFGSYITKLSSDLRVKTMYGISIIAGTAEYEEKLPGVSKRINEFNEILKEKTAYIDISRVLVAGGVIEDHHHINEIGHQIVFELLSSRLAEWIVRE